MIGSLRKSSIAIGIIIVMIGAGFVPTMFPNVKADPTDGLVGYWNFDDGTATDQSGYGNHGTKYGGPTTVTGVSGSALSFDGVDDWIDCGNGASLNPSTAITLAAWYKPTISWYGAGNDPIIDKPYTSLSGPTYQYHLGVCGNLYPVPNGLGLSFDTGAGGIWRWTGAPANTLTFNDWSFIVGTYDGSIMKLYVDGVLKSSKTVSGTISDYGQNLRFMKYFNFYGQATFLPGVIDEIRIYNRALNPSEITDLYEKDKADDWTVIAYLCDSNNLAGWGQNCLNYMDNVVGAEDEVNIIALLDGTKSGDSKACYINSNSNQVNIALNTINSNWIDEVDMGNPQVLIDFSEYCFDNYPANHYLIIPQNHGGSWAGCCWDDSSEQLTMGDLNNAFSTISTYINKKIDIVFFNDCLMNSVEIAFLLSPYVEFQVGSETISYTSSCDNEYTNILQHIIDEPDITPHDLAVYITDHLSLTNNAGYTTQSVSAFNLNKMGSLIVQIYALTEDLNGKLDNEFYRNEIQTARDQSCCFIGPYSGQIFRILDLYNFCQNIVNYVSDQNTDTIAQNIMNLLFNSEDPVIIEQKYTNCVGFSYGISIYFPDKIERYDTNYITGNNFALLTNWNIFLSKYYSKTTQVNQFTWDNALNAICLDSNSCSLIGDFFTFGEQNDATDNYDEGIDVYYADVPGNISIYSKIGTEKYLVDIRHGPSISKNWDVYIEWNGADSATINLSWNISNILVSEYPSITLYDFDANTQRNMRLTHSFDLFMESGETRHFQIICKLETNPPITNKIISNPKYGVNDGWVTSSTEFNLTATDDLSGIDATYYKIWYNGAWTPWNEYTGNFTLSVEGKHYLEFYSVDIAGNIEETHNQTHYVDDTTPTITVEVPTPWEALQDGVTLRSVITDICDIDWVKYAIREPGSTQGTIINPMYESLVASPMNEDKWQLFFDTTQLDDGYYVLFVNASDNLGNIGYTTVNFSIRNWAVLDMLPNTPNSKAGRTMPIKFSLRVAEAVDPTEPFVWNEELTIKIYIKGYPQNILQTSIYGSGSTNYRISSTEEHYITNFHTLSTPKTYKVDIWRDTLLVGSFEFATTK